MLYHPAFNCPRFALASRQPDSSCRSKPRPLFDARATSCFWKRWGRKRCLKLQNDFKLALVVAGVGRVRRGVPAGYADQPKIHSANGAQ